MENIREFIKNDGVYTNSGGRAGYIYVSANGKLAKVFYEFGTINTFLYLSATKLWTIPENKIISEEEIQQLKSNIETWANENKNIIEFV